MHCSNLYNFTKQQATNSANLYVLVCSHACIVQVIDEALKQLLSLQAQQHTQLEPKPHLIQHVQSGGPTQQAADAHI